MAVVLSEDEFSLDLGPVQLREVFGVAPGPHPQVRGQGVRVRFLDS